MKSLLPEKKIFYVKILFKNNPLCLFSILILSLCSAPLCASNHYLFPDDIISSSQQSFYADEFVNSEAYKYGPANYNNYEPDNYNFEQQFSSQSYLNYPVQQDVNYDSYDSVPAASQMFSYPSTRQSVNNPDYDSNPYLYKKPRYAIDEYLENQHNRTVRSIQQPVYQTDRRSALYNRSHSNVLYVSDLEPEPQKKIFYSNERPDNKPGRYSGEQYISEQYSGIPSMGSRTSAGSYKKNRQYNRYNSKPQLNQVEHIRYIPVVVYQMPSALYDSVPDIMLSNNMGSGLSHPGSDLSYNDLSYNDLRKIYALKNIRNLKKLNSVNMGSLINPVSSQYNPLSSFGVFQEINSKPSRQKVFNGYNQLSDELPFNHSNDSFSPALPHSPEMDIISSF